MRVPMILLTVVTLALSTVTCGSDESTACGEAEVDLVGTDCTVSWPSCEGGVTYSVECSQTSANTPNYRCTCVENSVRGASFNAEGYCLQPPTAVTAPANTGCDWAIDAN